MSDKVTVLLRLVGLGFLLWGIVSVVRAHEAAERIAALTKAPGFFGPGTADGGFDPSAWAAVAGPSYTPSVAWLALGAGLLLGARALSHLVFAGVGPERP